MTSSNTTSPLNAIADAALGLDTPSIAEQTAARADAPVDAANAANAADAAGADQGPTFAGRARVPKGETFSYQGTHYQVADSPALPKPVQRPHPPIIIGGLGARKTPRLAATFADEFNAPFAPPDTIKTQFERVRDAVDAVGRPAESMTYSAAFVVCAGRDEAEIARRAAAIGREVDELRSNSPLAGTPAQIVDQLGPFTEIGLQRVYLQLLDLSDLEHLQLFADEVQRQL